MFKNIRDSDWIEIDPLTAFIGRNEAGKTTLLKALHKLNPFKGEAYDIHREWPRGFRRDRRNDFEPCRAKFRLSEEERDVFYELRLSEEDGEEFFEFDERFLEEVEVGRYYSGELNVYSSQIEGGMRVLPHQDFYEVLESARSEYLSAISPPLSEHWALISAFIRERIVSGDLLELQGRLENWEEILSKKATANLPADQEFVPHAMARLRSIVDIIDNIPRPKLFLQHWVARHLPTFIYMDDFRTFEGSVNLLELQRRKREGRPSEGDGTFQIILAQSGLDLDELVELGQSKRQEDIERRQYDVADGATTLTNTLKDRFQQREYRVQFGLDGTHFLTFVMGENDESPIQLEERSKGFQWFFSFDLLFMHESQGTFEGCVLLIDEPGLHLHPDAQQDLLRRLEAYAEKNTLIYTTHLPFLLDMEHPERLRMLKESPTGTTITRDLTESSHDGKLVLQAALGMSARQSYLVAERNLLVEGVDDYWVLSALSNLFKKHDLHGLPEDVFITPCGGASELVYIATFMIGQELDVVALLDGDKAGKDAKGKLVFNWLTRYNSTSKAEVWLLEDVLGDGFLSGGAIEDLFPEVFLRGVIHEAYLGGTNLAVDEVDLPSGGSMWSRIKRYRESLGQDKPDNKGPFAKRLRRKLENLDSLDELPEETQNCAKRLFAKLHEEFPES